MKYYRDRKNVRRGATHDGCVVSLNPCPRIVNLAGRFAQNGIRIPSSRRWIVLPEGLIEERHVKEIERRVTVLPTLFIGVRRDGPIVQALGE